MARSFKQRFFSPPVAEALFSPLGIVLAGAGAAVGLATGLGVLGAVGLGALAWVGRIAAAIPRGDKRAARIDPFALSEPWRRYVQGALSAQARFERTVDATAGPMRETLTGIGRRLSTGVDDVWHVACRGDDIDAGRSRLDVRDAQAELARLEQEPAGAHTDATRQSLRAQLATDARMQKVSTDARDQLRLLDARLDELVARAVELSVSGSATAVSGLGDDVDTLVTEMESLRQAIEEVAQIDGAGPSGTGQPWPTP